MGIEATPRKAIPSRRVALTVVLAEGAEPVAGGRRAPALPPPRPERRHPEGVVGLGLQEAHVPDLPASLEEEMRMPLSAGRVNSASRLYGCGDETPLTRLAARHSPPAAFTSSRNTVLAGRPARSQRTLSSRSWWQCSVGAASPAPQGLESETEAKPSRHAQLKRAQARRCSPPPGRTLLQGAGLGALAHGAARRIVELLGQLRRLRGLQTRRSMSEADMRIAGRE